jgi:hypothetical protein
MRDARARFRSGPGALLFSVSPPVSPHALWCEAAATLVRPDDGAMTGK